MPTRVPEAMINFQRFPSVKYIIIIIIIVFKSAPEWTRLTLSVHREIIVGRPTTIAGIIQSFEFEVLNRKIHFSYKIGRPKTHKCPLKVNVKHEPYGSRAGSWSNLIFIACIQQCFFFSEISAKSVIQV